MQVVVKEGYYDVPKYAMSAEVENSKEGDGAGKDQQQPRRPLKNRLLVYWPIAIKLVQLIFCGLCIGFIHEPIRLTNLGKNQLHHVSLVYGTFIGHTIINCVLLLGHVLKDRQPFRTSMIFSVTGAILFAVTGIILLADKNNMTKHAFFAPHLNLIGMLITSATFALLNGLLFAIDAILTYKYYEIEHE